MRFECNLEGFTDNWVEISDSWTRREGKDIDALPEQKAFDKYFPLKVTACCIVLSDGTRLTDPLKINLDALDDADSRVVGFVARALYRAHREALALGNASARRSFNGLEPMTRPAPRLN